MTVAAAVGDLAALVARQVGRAPRTPWRVAATCRHGFPSVIASPSRLDDDTPFPTLYWLTCPYLAEVASAEESAGRLAEWDARIEQDASLAGELAAADDDLRARRAAESGGEDACGDAGVAGQGGERLAAKCLHARVALALAGVGDPIGIELLERVGDACDDRRCERLLPTRGT